MEDDEFEEILEDTFERWGKEFEEEHPIRHWVDNHVDGICDYSSSYFLMHPWIFFPWAMSRLQWAWQRVFRGWDDRVIWSIDWYLSEMLPLWLSELKEKKHGIPMSMFTEDDYEDSDLMELKELSMKRAEKEYNLILDKIADGFRAYIKMDETSPVSEEWEELNKEFQIGFDLFKEYFGTLWD